MRTVRNKHCHWCRERATNFTQAACGEYFPACDVHRGPVNDSHRPSPYRGRQITEVK